MGVWRGEVGGVACAHRLFKTHCTIVLDKGVTLERSAGQMGARLHVEIVEDEVEEFCR